MLYYRPFVNDEVNSPGYCVGDSPALAALQLTAAAVVARWRSSRVSAAWVEFLRRGLLLSKAQGPARRGLVDQSSIAMGPRDNRMPA